MTTKVKPSVLASTDVSSGTYGGSQVTSVFTVDAQGRLTHAANVGTSVAATNITGKVTASQIDTVASSQITGTIGISQIGGMTGEIKMWPAVSAPTGYLLCDGTAVSRTIYAALFAIIGTAYGTGNGSTTFNLPNFTDRMPIGVGTGATYGIGSVGGSKDSVVPYHTHSITDPTHKHWGSGNAYYGATALQAGAQQGSSPNTSTALQAAATGITINATGVSATNANLPPYLGVHFIIRY